MEDTPFEVEQCGVVAAVADGVPFGGVLALRVNTLVETSGGDCGGQVEQCGGVVRPACYALFKVPLEGFKVLAGCGGVGCHGVPSFLLCAAVPVWCWWGGVAAVVGI